MGTLVSLPIPGGADKKEGSRLGISIPPCTLQPSSDVLEAISRCSFYEHGRLPGLPLLIPIMFLSPCPLVLACLFLSFPSSSVRAVTPSKSSGSPVCDISNQLSERTPTLACKTLAVNSEMHGGKRSRTGA